MVEKLFAERLPGEFSRVLDPGCGNGEFIAGIVRFCERRALPVPEIVGVELDVGRAHAAAAQFAHEPRVTIRQTDFLRPSNESFDFIVGNPPYVSILALDDKERQAYRSAYQTAAGRFDLYVLFFEQALRVLAPGGRIVFITPEKFAYVETAAPLRALLRTECVEELHFIAEDTFGDRVTYPLITTVTHSEARGPTRVVHRDGRVSQAELNTAASWMPLIKGFVADASGVTLADVSLRISCGVATGADSAFVLPTEQVPRDLRAFAYPTLSGRQITPTRSLDRRSSILAPYDGAGVLLPEARLGALGRFLQEPERLKQLTARTCVARKPWYAYHDSLPLPEMLRPKLLCKDITESPFFVVDTEGSIVPRHSVYYVVPANSDDLEPLAEYLNSEPAVEWLRAHCQRAAGGFLRMQSHVLKRLPLPASFAPRPIIAQDKDANIELELLPA